eukprot:jgi/Tetstr1/433217/TSEL_022505.t1
MEVDGDEPRGYAAAAVLGGVRAPAVRTLAESDNFSAAKKGLPAKRYMRPATMPAHQLIIRQPTENDPEAPLVVMFGDPVDKGKAMDEATRSTATASNLIPTKIAEGRTAAALLVNVGMDGRARALLDRTGRRCAITMLGAPHLEDAKRPVDQAWVHGSGMRGLLEAEICTQLALGMLTAYDEAGP